MFSIGEFSRHGCPVDGIVVKRLTSVRVAELTGTATSYQPEDISPVSRAVA